MAELNRQQVIPDDLLQAPYQLSAGLKQVVADLKEIINTAAGVTKSLSTSSQSTQSQKKAADDLSRAQEKLVKANKQITSEVAKLNIQTAERNKQMKQEARESLGLVGAYEKLTRSLSNARKAYKDLAASGTATSQQLKAQKAVVDQLDSRVKAIDASTGQFQRNVGNYPGSFQKATNAVKSFLGAFGLVSGIYLLATAIKNAVAIIVRFEKTMSEVKAITGATGASFNALEKDALKLGATTRFTATQVGELQIAYGRLGFTTKEILAATGATLDLAAATGEDLAKSADVAGSTVKAFGLEATETQRVVDVMASSFNKSALGLENFAEAIKYVAPIAAANNISIEETTSLLGTLADNGIRGSMAGTSLRRIISDLKGETGTLSEKLQKLAAKGITSAQAMDEVGRHAYASLLILAKNTEQTDLMTEAYRNAGGEVAKMARIMADNAAGDILKLTSAWEGALLKFTNTSVFRKVTQAITDMINAASGTKEISKELKDLAEGLRDRDSLFNNAASLDIGVAITNLTKLRQETGKPIDLSLVNELATAYELDSKKANELYEIIKKVNESFSFQEIVLNNIRRIQVAKGYEEISDAANEYSKNIDALIVKETNHQQRLKQSNIDSGDDLFKPEIEASQELIEQYIRISNELKNYTSAKNAASNTPPVIPEGENLELTKVRLENELRAQEEIIKDESKFHDTRIDASVKAEKLRVRLVRLERDIEVAKNADDAQKQAVIRQKAIYAEVEAEKKSIKEREDLNKDRLDGERKLAEAVLNQNIKVNNAILASDESSDEQRTAALEENYADKQALLDIQYKRDQDNAKGNYDELIRLQKEYEAESKGLTRDFGTDLKSLYAKAFGEFSEQLQLQGRKGLMELNNQLVNGQINIKEYQQRRRELERNGNVSVLEEQKRFLEKQREELLNQQLSTFDKDKEIANKEIEIAQAKADALIEIEDEILRKRQENQEILDAGIELGTTIFNGVVDNRIAKLDNELAASEARREKELAGAGDNERRKAEIDKKFDKEQAKIKTKQAKADKDASLFNIAINTAANIVKVFPNPVLMALAAAIGLAQGIVVASREIPKFWMGSSYTPDTFIAGDRGSELVVHDNKAFVTPDRPTVYTGMEGATVIPHPRTEEILGSIKDADISRSILRGIRLNYTDTRARESGFSQEILQEMRTFNRNVKKLQQPQTDLIESNGTVYKAIKTAENHIKRVRGAALGKWL